MSTMHDKKTQKQSIGELIASDESAAEKITGDIFADLEATRRENGYLRKMLEEQSDG